MENHYHLFEFVCERIFGAKMLVSTSGLKNSVSSLKEKHTAHTHFDTFVASYFFILTAVIFCHICLYFSRIFHRPLLPLCG